MSEMGSKGHVMRAERGPVYVIGKNVAGLKWSRWIWVQMLPTS